MKYKGKGAGASVLSTYGTAVTMKAGRALSWMKHLRTDYPAKFAPGLIRRIYEHCFAQGYLKKGDTVVDPFGGIGSGGIFACPMGLRWFGVELEHKFVDLARQNFQLLAPIGKAMGYHPPIIFQADSRHLSEIIGQADEPCKTCKELWGNPENCKGCPDQPGADCIITSPPYSRSLDDGHPNNTRTDGTKFTYGFETPGQIGSMKAGSVDSVVTSPPYADQGTPDARHLHFDDNRRARCIADKQEHGVPDGYSSSPFNIGNLKAGKVEAVITSPPYAESLQGDGVKRIDWAKTKRDGDTSHQKHITGLDYGSTEGNIGNLKAGDVAAVVTSPPWENQEPSHQGSEHLKSVSNRSFVGSDYGNADGQLGQTSGDTYWQAVSDVYRECHKILKPGGVIVVVVKAYVKQGRRVPLPMQTLKLLIHLGFTPLERIKAMLVEETVTPGLFGEITKIKERKSFFRRLAEKKGSPRIDFEEVLICRRDKES